MLSPCIAPVASCLADRAWAHSAEEIICSCLSKSYSMLAHDKVAYAERLFRKPFLCILKRPERSVIRSIGGICQQGVYHWPPLVNLFLVIIGADAHADEVSVKSLQECELLKDYLVFFIYLHYRNKFPFFSAEYCPDVLYIIGLR